ncbi:hypothetical protein TWF788_007072 [Orbilia oligospora]|uniref:Transmembrane protein n=1 Tax=Orbilia oligospora TaxID=2813651 RepID=A0A6G1M6C6_ORBOL|nr:hypothetical protein TWF788_007072 [Orbilia oligospora]KAF3201801.1 hypothetical protein TWF679_011243 [Orbilia oligospora]KAF3230164.1 hypothetical protein TWF191_010866 [Orbilia oligospora]KAF3247618.1 hypothetical protein TWF192_006481 [Orbilia oligospora]
MAPNRGDIFEFLSTAAARATKDENAQRALNNLTLTRADGSEGLTYEDREIMLECRRKTRGYTQTGASIGLFLGLGAAVLSLRRRRLAFRNLRAMQGKGATIRFPDGREEIITNFPPGVRPSFMRNFMTFSLFGFTSYALGGLVGSSYGQKTLREYKAQHPDAVKRVNAWERRSVISMLKLALEKLEEVDGEWSERDNINVKEEGRGFDSWPPPDNPPPEFPRSF